jgi:hypothetical protein
MKIKSKKHNFKYINKGSKVEINPIHSSLSYGKNA